MKRRLIATILTMGMMTTALVGCGGKTQQSQNSSETGKDPVQNLIENTKGTVELTLWCSETKEYQGAMKEIVDKNNANANCTRIINI